MKKNRLFLIAPLFLLVTACSGEGGSDAAPTAKGNSPATAVDDAPQVDNEDLTPGLKGIDADANGIRDDVDRFIARHYSATSIMKKTAEQEARAFQKQVDAATPEQAIAAANAVSRAADCTFKILPHATEKDLKFAEDMSIEIKALTANTKERFEAYWRAQEMVSGAVFRDAKEPVCD
jgi:hypothetical protein